MLSIPVYVTENNILLFYHWIALAVYNRRPSAYEALQDLKILQLPHSKTLKQIIKDGLEKAGIDKKYLLGQHKTYVKYQKEREEEGHPRQLGFGVMMWDEVKVRTLNFKVNQKYYIMHKRTYKCTPEEV